MTTNSIRVDNALQPAWSRRSAPSKEQVGSFLQAGALFAWSEDRWIVAWGDPERSDKPRRGQPSFYAPDFFLSEAKPWLVYSHAAAVSPDGLAQQLATRKVSRVWQNFDPARFGNSFDQVQSAFKLGQLSKAVPAVFEQSRGTLTPTERERALRALANLPAGLMPYGHWNEDGGVLGASPELLFADDGVEIHSMAVAGTARAGAAPDELLDDPKERAEHRLVLEDVEAQLSPLGQVTRGATRLWRIGILSHLRTDLRLRPFSPISFDDLVHHLHPTPAVGTAPRQNWRDWIRQIDSAPRRDFAAPFGLVLPDGTSRCLVAIRQVQWDQSGARCGAGCGIVPESKLEREIDELRLKLAATRDNLGL